MMFNPHKLNIHRLLQYIPLNALFDAPYKAQLRRAVNIADVRSIAKARAHKMVFDYMDGGADDEVTLRRNKDAYTQLDMHYKVLSGIQPPIDMSTTVFGKSMDIPFFACPAAGNRMFHWEGETAVARAAQEYGTVYALSSLATTSMEQVTALHTTTERPKVFQLYLFRDKALNRELLAQAKEAGFDAVALTVDVARMGNRERDARNDFSIPPKYSWKQTIEALQKPAWTYDFLSHPPYTYACINQDVPAEALATFINKQLMFDFSWSNIEWILGEWDGPAVVKGIVRPDDAIRAAEMGFAAVWVSNHGGRQLDTAPATISVLPSIREALVEHPEVEIVLDGGIQRGTEIAKALALGADAVGIGKPYLWGLSAGGTEGVKKVFEILKVELDRAMGLLAVSSIQELKRQGPSLIKQRHGSIRDYPDRSATQRGYGGGIV